MPAIPSCMLIKMIARIRKIANLAERPGTPEEGSTALATLTDHVAVLALRHPWKAWEDTLLDLTAQLPQGAAQLWQAAEAGQAARWARWDALRVRCVLPAPGVYLDPGCPVGEATPIWG